MINNITREIVNDILKFHYVYFSTNDVFFRLSTDEKPINYNIGTILHEIVEIIDSDIEEIRQILNEIINEETTKTSELVEPFFNNLDFNQSYKLNFNNLLVILPSKSYNDVFIKNLFDTEFLKKFIAPLIVKSSKTWDYSLKSKVLFKELKKALPDDVPKELVDTMIMPIFVKQYLKVKEKELDALLDKVWGKEKYYVLLKLVLKDELDSVVELGEKYFFKYYNNTYLDANIKKFLSELVVYLGTMNWVVFWVGHGEVTNTNKLHELMDEAKCYQPKIIEEYDKWYDNAVVEYSTKIIDKK